MSQPKLTLTPDPTSPTSVAGWIKPEAPPVSISIYRDMADMRAFEKAKAKAWAERLPIDNREITFKFYNSEPGFEEMVWPGTWEVKENKYFLSI